MPKHWVRIEYSENPHPVEPCDAYKTIFQAVADADAGAWLDEMFYCADGTQYLLITTLAPLTDNEQTDLRTSLQRHDPEFLHSNLSALGELPSNGGGSAA